MGEKRSGRETDSAPIFVRPSPRRKAIEQVVRFLLASVTKQEVTPQGAHTALRDFVLLLRDLLGEAVPVPLEGQLSDWVSQLPRTELGDRTITSPAELAAYLETCLGTLRSAEDQQIRRRVAQQLGALSPQERAKFAAAVRAGNLAALEKMVPLGTRVLPSCSMLRAAIAASWCLLLHREEPASLIERARQGDERAALDLIKVDKLFLHDSCTEKVIREAEIRKERGFLDQLARALRHEPSAKGRQLCRLLLYLLLGLGIKLPKPHDLQAILDPDGTVFKGSYAFGKFVQRCRGEFGRLRSQPSLPGAR